MKHIYKYLFVPVIILTGFACSDDLLDKQPLDKFSEASVWGRPLTWLKLM